MFKNDGAAVNVVRVGVRARVPGMLFHREHGSVAAPHAEGVNPNRS